MTLLAAARAAGIDCTTVAERQDDLFEVDGVKVSAHANEMTVFEFARGRRVVLQPISTRALDDLGFAGAFAPVADHVDDLLRA